MKSAENSGKVASAFEKDPLHHFASRLSSTKTVRDGYIVLRLTGVSGGNYCFQCKGGRVALTQDPPSGNHPIELIGNAERIRSVLDGKKDARAQFLAGGFRVRGDVRYISDLGMELGILKQPI